MSILLDILLAAIVLGFFAGHRWVRLSAAFFTLSALLLATAGAYLLSLLWCRPAAQMLRCTEVWARMWVFAGVCVAGFILLRVILSAMMGPPRTDRRGGWLLASAIGMLAGAVLVVAVCVVLDDLARVGVVRAEMLQGSALWRAVRWMLMSKT